MLSRSRRYLTYLLEAGLFVGAFMAISAWQSRNLLETDRHPAPPLRATTLNGEPFELSELTGKPVLVYFFAPWCPYCSASADNIVRLRKLRDTESLTIVMVALDWADSAEIQDYAIRHELNVPVLLGDDSVVEDWRVYAFPTYYVLDSKLRVVRRDMGYSTQFGLWWRSWIVS